MPYQVDKVVTEERSASDSAINYTSFIMETGDNLRTRKSQRKSVNLASTLSLLSFAKQLLLFFPTTEMTLI